MNCQSKSTLPTNTIIQGNQKSSHIFQTGDLIIFSANDWMSRIIRFVSWSPFEHVVLVFKGPLQSEKDSGLEARYKNKLRIFEVWTQNQFSKYIFNVYISNVNWLNPSYNFICRPLRSPLQRLMLKGLRKKQMESICSILMTYSNISFLVPQHLFVD